MSAYYNENDPKAAAWLRELIRRDLIAQGDVDERSILDVSPVDLVGYRQCHFFAGIGVWSYALRLAGIRDDDPMWTGSCPCQPFSSAGDRGGFADERHLWPAFHWLIEQHRPVRVIGEQVASKDGLAWLDLISDDMEGSDYAIGAVDTCSASFGAPHIRQRLYWMAYAHSSGLEGRSIGGNGAGEHASRPCGMAGGLADADGARPGPTNGLWRDVDWLGCRDGKWRPVEPGTFPLAHGAPARVGRLRGYGNAINAQQAAAFIQACFA